MRLLVGVLALFVAAVVIGLTPRWALGSGETTPERNVSAGKAVVGYGQIRYGGKGPEAWRWEKIQADRRADRLQRRLTARVLQVERLRSVVGQSFIPPYWVEIASCESGVDWDYNGRSGFDGAVQFHPGTWSAYRLPSYPAFAYQASPFQQLVIAELVLARQGWGAWPACSRKLGLR